jgi:hypothetical protein
MRFFTAKKSLLTRGTFKCEGSSFSFQVSYGMSHIGAIIEIIS